MRIPKSIFDQANIIAGMDMSLFKNPGSEWIKQMQYHERMYRDLIRVNQLPSHDFLSSINGVYSNLSIPAFNKIMGESFRPPKMTDLFFDSTTRNLFKSLSVDSNRLWKNLTFPENPIDLMVSRHLRDFEDRHQERLKLFHSEFASAIAITKLIGSDGINNRYEELLNELENLEAKKNSTVEETTKLRGSDLLMLFITILIVLYQEYSQYEMEERLGNKIEGDSVVLEQKIDKVEQLILTLSQVEQKPFQSAEYVVMNRATFVREEGKNGSKVIAQLFPNQVVTLIDADGKWVEVTYYDWVENEYMNGWVLKKYLQRLTSK